VLAQITVLLLCQLVGEVIARLAGLPVPGPVIGMALLFAILVIRRGIPPTLGATVGGLLEHLSLLFVPAGVGVIVHLPLIRAEWPAITVAVVASTILAIAVTGLLMRWLVKGSS
jgi:holin-like protein